MYNNPSGVILPATGAAIAIWLPLAGFALIAAGFAIWRIGAKRKQPKA